VETAIQEDADLIGLSVLAGDALAFFARLMDLLAERDATDIAVLAGGHLPAADVPALERLGVSLVVPLEASPGEVARWVAAHVPEQAGEAGPVRGG
jgi:methylmalonyl-CoA mutase C-terminal domain/subunit